MTEMNPPRASRRFPTDAFIAMILAAGGLLFWLSYALRARFLYDDWSIVANYTYDLHAQVSFRPGFILWAPLQVHLFGLNPLPYYLFAHAVFATTAALAFVALRSLDVPRPFAAFASLFVLLAPDADGAHLWWTGMENTLSAGIILFSVALGARWSLRRESRWLLLLSECAVLVGSGMYELSAALVLLPLCLFWRTRTPRRLLLKLVIDLGVAAVAMTGTYFENKAVGVQSIRPLSEYGPRLVSIFGAGLTMIERRVATLLGPGLLVLAAAAALGLVVCAIPAARRRLADAGHPSGASPAPAAAGAALLSGVCVFVSWVSLVPANDWYLPTLLGLGNRVNSTAVLFEAVFVAMVLWAFTSAGKRFPLPRAVVAATAATLLLAAFGQASVRDAGIFVDAAARREAILTELQHLSPRLSHHSIVLLGDYNTYRGYSWVPLLAADWDTSGALKLAYRDPSLSGAPLLDDKLCRDAGVVALGKSTPYALVTVVDVDRGLLLPLRNRESCLAAARRPARPYPA